MEFSIQPYFGSWGIIAVLFAVVIVVVLFLKEQQNLSRMRRLTLALIRFAVIGILFLTLLRPGFTFSRDATPESTIAVVVDQSGSMQLPSGISTETRSEIAKSISLSIASAAETLGEGSTLKLYTFDSRLREPASNEAEPDATQQFVAEANRIVEKPEGTGTDIPGPIKEVIERNVNPPLQSLVWLSDGIQTLEESSLSVRQIARQLAESDVPMYVVGIGPRTDAERTMDQWVDGVPEQIDAFTKNVVNLRGLLRVVGLTNRRLELVTTVRKADGTEISVNRQTITPNRIDQTLPFTAPVTATEQGAFEVEIEAVPVDGEATLRNNRQICFMNVRETGSRLLYLEGEPRAEQKFLRIALADSRDLQVEVLPIYRNTMGSWPLNGLANAIKEGTYDCFILGDIDSNALGNETIAAIVDQVTAGAGLITLGGYHAYGPGGYAETPLAFALPFNISGFRRQAFDAVDTSGHITGPVKLSRQRRHPIFELDPAANLSDQQLIDLWSQVPPFNGANRVNGLLPQEGIQLLAQSEQGDPLIATKGLGSGRVLSMTFDSTYLWWRDGFSNHHRRFWRQAVLWAMQSQDREPGLKISMDRRRLRLGADARYTIEWTGETENEAMPQNLEIRLEQTGEESRPLVATQVGGPIASGAIAAMSSPGRYQIVARVSTNDGTTYVDRLPFDVIDDAVELIKSAPDWQLMGQIAELNSKAGGQLLSPDQTDTLIDLLKQRSQRSRVSLVESHHLGEGPLDSWIVFLAISMLLTIQWLLRKRWSLA